MERSEKTFVLRFSLSASPPVALLEEEDFEIDDWLREWETQIKPGLVRAIFQHLRSFDAWTAHVRNRGISPEDEIEVVVERRYLLDGGGESH